MQRARPLIAQLLRCPVAPYRVQSGSGQVRTASEPPGVVGPIEVVDVGADKIALRWTPPATDGGSPILRYEVWSARPAPPPTKQMCRTTYCVRQSHGMHRTRVTHHAAFTHAAAALGRPHIGVETTALSGKFSADTCTKEQSRDGPARLWVCALIRRLCVQPNWSLLRLSSRGSARR